MRPGTPQHPMAGDGQTGGMDDQAAVVEALALAVSVRVPVLFWGSPGTGKTSVVRSLAEAIGLPVRDRDRLDPRAVGLRRSADRQPRRRLPASRLRPAGWAQRLAAAGNGVLFFDEISTAPPAVQAALLRVVLERTVGDLELPRRRRRGGGRQPARTGCIGMGALRSPGQPVLPPRLGDRRQGGGRRTVGWLAGPPHPGLPEGWQRWIGVARSWVGGFIRVRPTLAVEVPEDAATAGKGVAQPPQLGHGGHAAGGRPGGRLRRPGAISARARRRGPRPGDRTAHLAGRSRPARPRRGPGRPRLLRPARTGRPRLRCALLCGQRRRRQPDSGALAAGLGRLRPRRRITRSTWRRRRLAPSCAAGPPARPSRRRSTSSPTSSSDAGLLD